MVIVPVLHKKKKKYVEYEKVKIFNLNKLVVKIKDFMQPIFHSRVEVVKYKYFNFSNYIYIIYKY